MIGNANAGSNGDAPQEGQDWIINQDTHVWDSEVNVKDIVLTFGKTLKLENVTLSSVGDIELLGNSQWINSSISHEQSTAGDNISIYSNLVIINTELVMSSLQKNSELSSNSIYLAEGSVLHIRDFDLDTTTTDDRSIIRSDLTGKGNYEDKWKSVNKINTSIKIWLPLDDEIDMLYKGYVDIDSSENSRRLTNLQISFAEKLKNDGYVKSKFNKTLFTSGDSREAEQAGILGALVGSALMLLITFFVAFPLAVAAAIYLEEFAPKNKFTELIEVNIANLAAVPSIVFGLLGLGILLNVFGFPRSTPLVGGTVLALMTLPTIIIACRASLKAVPPSIKEGALAMGASKMQAVFHHQVPLALPGTLTGTIIGLAQALGETAPLIMIGMIAFIPNIPTGFTEPSAALPVQIYLWVESAERGFQEKTAAAIMMILIFLFLMNAIAVFLRSRFERKW